MFSLTYVSSATRHFSVAELESLLTTCVRNNAERGLTGLLLYKGGNFMQVLEGEEGAVLEVFETIRTDPRHDGIIRLYQGHADARQFPEWSMGFEDLDAPETRERPGLSGFLDTPLTGDEFAGNPTRAQKLLLTFKRTM